MTQRGSNLIPTELLLEAYRRMHRIRIFEERVAVLLRRGEIHGGAHTAVGQEASVVGSLMAVNSDDFMTGTHRSHGHPIGKGADIGPLMAELMSRTTGICGGRGGSMHLADFKVGSLGESGIVASGMPVAVGAGLSAKLLKTGRVCVAFFGDGAANEGAAHEAMNLASVWKLPVIFLCENNGYAITTSQKTGMVVENVADRAAGYGMPGVTVDGQDFFAVYAAMTEAVGRARRGEGPTLLETKTYRYHEHALGLVLNYRTDEEIERWKGRDPLALMAERLVADGVASEAELAALVEAETKAVEDAVVFGRAGPKPEPDDAFNEVYANPFPIRFDDRTVGGAQLMAVLSYLEAVRAAQADEMARDDTVIVLGEDVRANMYGGTGGLFERFGPDRVLDTPISESAIVGAGVGAAMTGMRPIVDFGMAGFIYTSVDQIVSQAAKNRYMFGGQKNVPVTFRAMLSYGRGSAAHHADRPYPMFMGIPGLKIIIPSSPADAKGLLRSAIREDDPVMSFEDSACWNTKEEVPDGEIYIPLGKGRIRREGSDVTVVAIAGAVLAAEQAAAELEQEGISVEIIDPRTLVPLDHDIILNSVAKTGRLVIADPAARTCGSAGEIAAIVAEDGFDSLKWPILRVTAPDIPMPFSKIMEEHLYPNKARITKAVKRLMG